MSAFRVPAANTFAPKRKIIVMDKSPSSEKFFPRGAIAFFVLLVILCLIIWFGIYFLMLQRA
jgi:hypothetical protein